MPTIPFSVDSRLLRELGERLVGRPHIALAELIKNAYDADATLVEIVFGADSITITDNGHGMSSKDFKQRWMRIGSTHKERQGTSPRLKRRLTGSKGVGRLSVQLLADQLEVRSRVADDPHRELKAVIDWTEAAEAGLLTTAKADVTHVKRRGDPNRETGVTLKLTGLHQTWDRRSIEKLGEQIWPLQPPFRTNDKRDFVVKLETEDDSDDDLAAAFASQMTAVLELWSAKISGRLLPASTTPTPEMEPITNPDLSDGPRTTPRVLDLRIELAGRPAVEQQLVMDDCHIDQLSFEIRVYSLHNRQPRGISVGEARRYLNDYGGVHVYDAGFHLPYYGPEADWLRIEKDHAHRRGSSDYLPKSLQFAGGAAYVPTNSRLYGTVEVSTAHELAMASRPLQATDPTDPTDPTDRTDPTDPTDPTAAERDSSSDGQGQYGRSAVAPQEALRIQVTRDRLVDTVAYRNLVTLVRSAVDVYAMAEARRAFEEAQRNRDTTAPSPRRVEHLAQTLRRYRDQIPAPVYDELTERVEDTTRTIRAEYEARVAQTGLLASLATAGVSALAYEHEVSKQFLVLESIATELRRSAKGSDGTRIADDIAEWIQRARATRALFSPLLDSTNRETRGRLKAKETVREVLAQVTPLMRGAELVNEVSRGVRLPAGSFAEWSALFQNLFINAANAMLDSEERLLAVSDVSEAGRVSIDVQDTGVGIDLSEAHTYFEPFRRKVRVSQGRAELGLGGTGLGLTIVSMLADELGCSVEFVEPGDGYSTCARISWEETP